MLVVVFFVTSSDSGSLVIDVIAAGGKIDAPTPQRVFWCVFEGLVAIALILGGGLVALQAMAVSTGFPFTDRAAGGDRRGDQGADVRAARPSLTRGPATACRTSSSRSSSSCAAFRRSTSCPRRSLQRVAQSVDVRYYKAGTQIVEFGQEAQYWHVVRSGAVEVFRRDGSLYNRLTEGGYFGEAGLLQRKRVRFPVRALEDTLLYLIPERSSASCSRHNEHFADIVATDDSARLRQVVSRREESNQLLSATIDTPARPRAGHARPLRQRARRGAADDRGQGLVAADRRSVATGRGRSRRAGRPDDGDRDGVAVGIVTDRDIRNRLVAQGLGYDTPVRDIMSSRPGHDRAQPAGLRGDAADAAPQRAPPAGAAQAASRSA